MSAPAPPVVPARPSKSPSKEAQQATLLPSVPARPTRKSVEQPRPSSSDRFAPSPLHGGIQPKSQRPTSSYSNLDPAYGQHDPIERPGSVSLPSLGEEGREYGVLGSSVDDAGNVAAEQTRTVSENLKLHAPKPSLPADTAKQQIMAVTRTDSEKAASLGLGLGMSSQGSDRPPSRDPLLRRPSSALSTHSDHGNHTDDEHGIPKIGQRVPMNSHLGDVQAPSPGPDERKKHHSRKHSARNMPPGSYGLHGHGVDPRDKLEKAYYEKHPELGGKDKKHHVHDHRQSDFAMSSNDLNRMVKETAKRRPISGHFNEATSVPTDDVAYNASDEYAYRISTPQYSSHAEKGTSYFPTESSSSQTGDDERSTVLHAIHVDDSKHPEHYSYGAENQENTAEYKAPILAGDEIDAGPDVTARHPAIRPGFDRSRSYDADEPKIPSIRHPVLVHDGQPEREFNSTPLEDVEEYEPLFDEEKKEEEKKQAAAEKRASRHFPSKDIWEDAPSSVHYSTEVSTPDVEEHNQRQKAKPSFSEGRSITPAQAFAQYQEELAEKEAKGRTNNFLPLSAEVQTSKPKWIDHQAHLGLSKPPSSRRFPSKDIWEDAPDSAIHESTLSESPPENEDEQTDSDKPEISTRPVQQSPEEHKAVPVIPSRPKPKQTPSDDAIKQPPSIPDRPKPQPPARPAKKFSGDSKDGEAVKPPKPPVPSRPAGSKIAALQAGFMSDLNKRLQLGPQAPKKEEPVEEEAAEEKEKAPLTDARKSRARGPQRRAPAKATSPVKEPSVSVLCISQPQTQWSIDPEDGIVIASEQEEDIEPLRKTDSSKETSAPLTKQVSKEESDLSLVKEPSHESSKVESRAVVAEPAVIEQTEPAEPAVKAIDEASEDIPTAELPSADVVEDKPAPHVHHDADVPESAKEKDIGDVPLAEAKTEEAA